MQSAIFPCLWWHPITHSGLQQSFIFPMLQLVNQRGTWLVGGKISLGEPEQIKFHSGLLGRYLNTSPVLIEPVVTWTLPTLLSLQLFWLKLQTCCTYMTVYNSGFTSAYLSIRLDCHDELSHCLLQLKLFKCIQVCGSAHWTMSSLGKQVDKAQVGYSLGDLGLKAIISVSSLGKLPWSSQQMVNHPLCCFAPKGPLNDALIWFSYPAPMLHCRSQ